MDNCCSLNQGMPTVPMIWPHAMQEQRGAEAVFEGPPLFVAQSKKRRMSAEQDPKACKSSRLEATRRHVQNRGLESTRDSPQEGPILESGSGLSHNFEGGCTGSPELASTVGQPTGLKKLAQNREFIANHAIPASARPTNPGQTLTYTDLAAVESALAQTTSDWNPLTPDSSIPTTTAQRRFWAGRVKAAVKNTEGHIQGKPYKLWKKGNDVGSILSPETSEYISYKIVDIAERLHT
ncbi:hypothetical protein E8E12_006980 [Didymella heteroderae]|uniref:Uncharacterized protein n=1 Tax=Didymella heteroderae TaxID=1769908 RepID=A0A9P4WKW5_9PLEO|nr:hypothetical protein E8E12_006980 [Didymella heteroderae]